MTAAVPSAAPLTPLDNFSLFAGGPLYQLWRTLRLADAELHLTQRRAAMLALLAWVPLLLLAILDGRAWGSAVALPFLSDIEMHAKLLVVIPLLITAEVTAHERLGPVVRQFFERNLVPATERARFDAAIASALRLRNSVVAEIVLVALVYVIGIFVVWRTQSALGIPSWYADPARGGLSLTPAGWWTALVSLPIAQFLLVRWYFRLFTWARFLVHVSRLRLNLIPTHPDGVAGLHFLASSRRAYNQLLLAQGTLLSGAIASRVLYQGADLMAFKTELVGTVVVLVFAILGPLLAFAPMLQEARRVGLLRYGVLAQSYAAQFDAKWVNGTAPSGEALLGSADIQSLADFRNSFSVVQNISVTPFTLRNVVSMAFITLLPVAPLLLTTFSLEQLLDKMLSVLL